MKNTIYIIKLFIICVLFLSACKKENLNNSPTTNSNNNICSSSSYETPLNNIYFPYSIDEDNDGNTYLLGQYLNQTKIIKIDNTGNIVWEKDSMYIPGTAVQLSILNDNSLIVVSYDDNVIYSSSFFMQAFYQNGIIASHNCVNSYEWNDQCYTVGITAKTYVSKLSSNADVIWTKDFNESYVKGKCLIEQNNNLLFITMKLNGKQPIFVFDSFGVFQDTVNYPIDKNIIEIYCLDLNGNINWEKQIENIYNIGYEQVVWGIDAIITNNNIVIKTTKELIILDNCGAEINRLDIYPNYCNNGLILMLKADQDNVIITGNYYTIDSIYGLQNYSNYTQKINLYGQVLWQIDVVLNLKNSNNQRFVSANSSNIEMYDINGNLLWNIDEYVYNIHACYLHCNNGVTYIKQYGTDVSITRTNDNGLVN